MLTCPTATLAETRYEYALRVAKGLEPSSSPKIVFDVGAGDGRMMRPLNAAGFSWYGFDLKPSSSNILEWDISKPCPIRNPVPDIILLLDVVEHLVNPGMALAQISQVLPTGGRLILTAPNPLWSRSRIHSLLHGNPTCFTQSDLDLNGHVFTTWPHILAKLLFDAGFDLVEYVTLEGKTEWPWRPISIRYPLRLLQALACKVIERLDPSACGMSFGLVARVRG